MDLSLICGLNDDS